MTLLVSNEERELVEAVLKYHFAQGVAFMVVTAHQAPERTLEILERYSQQGRLEFRQELGTELRQREQVTAMARRAATEYDADWVINADADEFFWPERGTLAQVFEAIPERFHTLAMPLCHFVPCQEEAGYFADRLVIRETVVVKGAGWFGAGVSEADAWAQLRVPSAPSPDGRPIGARIENKTAHRGRPDIAVDTGNHRVFGEGLVAVPPAWRPVWQPVTVMHFPMRSYRQYEAKIVQWAKAAPDWDLARQLYSLYREGGLRAYYEDRLLGQAQVEEGIREGRLMVDERLRHFLAELRTGDADVAAERTRGQFRDTGGRRAWPGELLEVAELRAELERALYLRDFDPLTRRVINLQQRTKRANERRRQLRRQAKRTRERAQRQSARVAAIEGSRWWWLGSGVRTLARRAGFGRPARSGR